jgi:hypothetical protein
MTERAVLDKHTVAEIARRTVDTVRDVLLELPDARTPQAAAEVLLGGERKMYVGVALAALALLLLVLLAD